MRLSKKMIWNWESQNWRKEKRPCHSPCFGTRAGSWQFKHLTGRRTLLGKTLNEMDLLTLWMPHDAATFMLQHSHCSICHQKHFQTKGRIHPGLEGRFYDEIILLFCCKAGFLLLQIVWIQRPGRNAGGWIWAMHDGFCFRNDNNSQTLMKTTWKKWAWLENGPSVQHRHPQNIDDSFQMPNQNKHEHTEWLKKTIDIDVLVNMNDESLRPCCKKMRNGDQTGSIYGHLKRYVKQLKQ